LKVLIPSTIAASSLGAFWDAPSYSTSAVMLVAGVFGYVMTNFRYPLTGLILGLVLGPMAEQHFIQSAEFSGWDFTVFFTCPICIFLWNCIAASLTASGILFRRNLASAGED
jgi:putative tricarboxylic transport membrane protein